jgi:hypothetical protein
MLIGSQIHDLTTELAAIIAPEPSWGTTLSSESIQHRHHMFATEPLAHLNPDTFPSKHIHHHQRAKPESMGQLIGNKVQGLGVMGLRHRWPVDARHYGFSPSWRAVT